MTSTRFPDAFNGDPFIEAEIRRIVASRSITTIVETGTHLGKTTRAFSDMVAKVVTVEIDQNFWDLAKHLDLLANVRRFRGDSPKVLQTVLPELRGPILFYLDAHWGAHSPLLDELDAIALARLKPVIAIHDFQNPPSGMIVGTLVPTVLKQSRPKLLRFTVSAAGGIGLTLRRRGQKEGSFTLSRLEASSTTSSMS